MTNSIVLTKLESAIFKEVVGGVYNDCGYSVAEISKFTGQSKETVRGVVGSLTKKGLVSNYEHDVNGKTWDVSLPVFLLNPEASNQWFLCDNYGSEEWEALVKANYDHLGIQK